MMHRDAPHVPTCPDAEAAVIGSILVDGTAFDRIASSVSTADFFTPWCRQVFAAALALCEQGRPLDSITIRESLRSIALLDDEMESAMEQAELSVPSAASARDYADIVRDVSNRRRILEVGVRLQEASSQAPDKERAVELLSEALERVSHTPHTPIGGCDTHGPLRLIPIEEYMTREIPPIEWHWDSVVPCGAVVLLVGNAKLGKTTLTRHYVRRVCHAGLGGSGGGGTHAEFLGKTVVPSQMAWFPVEEAPSLFRSKLEELQLVEGTLFLPEPTSRPLTLGDLPILSRLVQEHRIDQIIIDPFSDFACLEDENDAARVGAVFRSIRAFTRSTGCTVILIHHTNKDKSGLGAVRGSTAISAGVDSVLLFDAPEGEESPVRRIRVKSRYGNHEFRARLEHGVYTFVSPDDIARERDVAKVQKDVARKQQRRSVERERIDIAKSVIRSANAVGATRNAAIEAGLPTNQVTRLLDTACDAIGGRKEPGGGNRKTLWFGPSGVRR